MDDTTTMSTSASSVRTLHKSLADLAAQRDQQLSASSATERVHHSLGGSSSSCNAESAASALVLPSPPDSPNLSPIHSATHSPYLDSVSESSLPSVSSSFFFSSSAPGSPGRSRNSSYPHSEHEHERINVQLSKGHNLIIPSLTLPSALRRPTPFGQTLGELRLLVLGAQGAGKSFLTGLLLEDNEDVIEVGTWEDWEEGASADDDGSFSYGKVLRASTDWYEQKDTFGLERFEPTKNVHIVELPGYSQDADTTELITRLKKIIEAPFRALHNVLHPDTAPSGVVANLLASPTSPLYTAMVFLLPSAPTPLDLEIITALSTHIPLIVLPRLHGPHRDHLSSSSGVLPKLSSFCPASAVSLRSGLFHSPETVALLRGEAADRFLRWREVERSVDAILGGAIERALPENSSGTLRSGLRKRRLGERDWGRSKVSDKGKGKAADSTDAGTSGEGWSKARWEAEWMEGLSKEVDTARRAREATVTQKSESFERLQRLKNLKASRAFTSTSSASGPLDSRETRPNADTSPSSDPEHSEDHNDLNPYGPGGAAFDPLHLPSLIIFSVSLLGPLKERLSDSVREILLAFQDTQIRVALLGGLCVGVGVGIFASR